MIRFNNHFVRVSLRREDFRVAISKPMTLNAGFLFLFTEVLLIYPAELTSIAQTLYVPCALLVLCASLLLLLSTRYHFQVGPDGVDYYGIWPRVRHLNWGEVTRARLCRIFGLECLILQTEKRWRSLRLPLCVDRSDLCLKMISTYSETGLEFDEETTDEHVPA
ncbi:hypothetical protein SH661x_002042 [Planctomicrobium sp. SH661]|uniref:hypothetical protein n=1 Tax=Planctomicrobium sp. SH661 TaxID=3448124 RepID=UPI003F5BEC3C